MSRTDEIVVIDYGSGNTYSVVRALEAVCDKARVCLSADPEKIRGASHIILPGVGAFDACYQKLTAQEKTFQALCAAVQQQAKPFLGICVGAQLLGTRGLEWGESAGLGWIQGESAPLENTTALALPHMGWNSLEVSGSHSLFSPLASHDVYFANSFALRGVEEKYIAATSFYGASFCAAVAKDNIIGTQFHPEKSQAVGLAFLSRFVSWQP